MKSLSVTIPVKAVEQYFPVILLIVLYKVVRVVVSALDFRSKGRWFDAQFLPSCCFLRQETSPHIVSLHPGV